MTPKELLLEMDEILGLPAGTLRGDEKLDQLQNWDSMSLVTFIALADAASGVSISPSQVVNCSTIADLVRLAQGKGTSA